MASRDEEINPFKPPSASLEAPAPERSDLLFFTASTLKFFLMSFFTFGIYDIYWFYKNWKAIGKRSRRDITAFWRAIFAVIFAFECFREIGRASSGGAKTRDALAVALGIAYLVFNVLARFPAPYWFISLASFAPVLVANGWAQEANASIDAEAPENSRLSAWNWAALVAGFLFMALATIGLLSPPPPAQ